MGAFTTRRTALMNRRHLLGSLALLAAPPAFALYEPAPLDLFKHLPGTWRGALTYRDWSPPHRLVSLPCTLYAALTSPREASLFFVFQDGPGKVVYSYDRWTVDASGDALAWASGDDRTAYALAAAPSNGGVTAFTLSREANGKIFRQDVSISPTAWRIQKVELMADGSEEFRNGYELMRSDRSPDRD